MSIEEYETGQGNRYRIDKLRNLLRSLQNDILDEYNSGVISYTEMKKVLIWTDKMIDQMIDDII